MQTCPLAEHGLAAPFLSENFSRLAICLVSSNDPPLGKSLRSGREIVLLNLLSPLLQYSILSTEASAQEDTPTLRHFMIPFILSILSLRAL